jgi:alkanesulfonate monooxygenase
MTGMDSPLVFSTCPQSKGADSGYLDRVAEISRWSEAAGCEGMLVYTDNSLVDPWLVTQVALQATERLAPLVAVQPVYMHPYSVAKMVASLAFMHGRRIYLNMLAGGFKNDLVALGDETPHDDRYLRTVEYTNIVMALLAGETVTHEGRYYDVQNLRLTPEVPPELRPGLLMSGSSPAGLAAAHEVGATPVKYPKPHGEEDWAGEDVGFGVRVGIIARSQAEEAWRVAVDRFPDTREGKIAHKLAMSVSDSHWHEQLSELDPGGAGENGQPGVYWLGPFQNYHTFCPYLVGTYERVAAELAGYMKLGAGTFILDIPASREELEHVATVFQTTRPAPAA